MIELRMKRFQQVCFGFMVGSMVVGVVSCGSQSAPETETSAESPAAESSEAEAGDRMAVILYGPANDNSWSQAAYEGAKALEAQGVEVAISESVAETDVARVLRQYAEEGYPLIIAHSFSYQDAVFEVAEEYPEVNFAWAGGINRVGENVADYDQPFFEGAYLVGILAANLSETGQLGALYGFDIPVCFAMGEAMLAGAKTVRPDATLAATAVGDWVDVGKAKEAALAQAETGVDFWMECGEGPALGAIEAAKETGGYATGYVGDMSNLGPEVVAASVVWNMEPLFQMMLEDAEAGSFANQYYQPGVAEDVVQISINPAIEAQLEDGVMKTIADTQAQIASGELEVPFVPAK